MTLNKQEIQDIIPHRDPFLLLDEVVRLEPGRFAAALWHLRGDEDFFRGHFPGFPVVPGVLLAEAAAQTGAVALLCCPEHKGKLGLLAGLNKARFVRPVRPGDTLQLEAEIESFRFGIGTGKVTAAVEGEKVFSGIVQFALQERQKS